MSGDYARGGIVGPAGATVTVVLDDDECVWDRSGGGCVRDDDRHNFEMAESRRLGDPEPRLVRTRCLHRACHVVPVESGGELVARLCRACDQQLPTCSVCMEPWPCAEAL